MCDQENHTKTSLSSEVNNCCGVFGETSMSLSINLIGLLYFGCRCYLAGVH